MVSKSIQKSETKELTRLCDKISRIIIKSSKDKTDVFHWCLYLYMDDLTQAIRAQLDLECPMTQREVDECRMLWELREKEDVNRSGSDE